jgi:uridine kinase
MIIIGIAGGTGSGKTTVVHNIIENLSHNEVSVIPQDSYYNDSSHVPWEERKLINFDHPDSIEWSLLTEHIKNLRAGHPIHQPKYSYITCTRLEETVLVKPCKVIIVEGILVLTQPELREQMDLKIYVDADPDDRLIRVVRRDVLERGRTPEMVLERYERVLKPMHLEFIEPTKRYADIIVPQGGKNRPAIDMLTRFIRSRLGSNE